MAEAQVFDSRRPNRTKTRSSTRRDDDILRYRRDEVF